MKFTNKFLAICAVCLLTSLSAFSQAAIQPSDKTVAVNEVKPVGESTGTVEPKTEETKTMPKRQSSGNAENWRGFYIGGNVGGTSSKNSLITSTAPCGGTSGGFFNSSGVLTSPNGCGFDQSEVDIVNRTGNKEANPKGFTGGVQAGYNFQADNFVAGVETDFNSFRQNQTVSGTENNFFPQTITQTIKTSWLMTLRARAGFTAGKALIYGTGGLAVTNLNYQFKLDQAVTGLPPAGGIYARNTANNTIKETKAGWTAGAGAEFKVSNRWSVRGEYLYTRFNTSGKTNLVVIGITSSGATGTAQAPNSFLTSNVKLKSHHFRFGVNYRF